MSVKAIAWAWELDLPPTDKYVLIAYVDHADHEGNNIRPSKSLIAWKTGYTQRAIQLITTRLVKAGLLIEVSRLPGKKISYRVNIDEGKKQKPRVKGRTAFTPEPDSPPNQIQGQGRIPFGSGGESPERGLVVNPSIEPSNKPSLKIRGSESSRVESNSLTSFGSNPLTPFVDEELEESFSTSAPNDESQIDLVDPDCPPKPAPPQPPDYTQHYKGVRAVPKPAPKEKKAKAGLGKRRQDVSDEQQDSYKPRYTPSRPTVVPVAQKREKTPLKAESAFVEWVRETWGGKTLKDEAVATLLENEDLFEQEGFKEFAAAAIQESNEFTKTEYGKPRSSSKTIADRITDREAFEGWKVEQSAVVAAARPREEDVVYLTDEEWIRMGFGPLETKERGE